MSFDPCGSGGRARRGDPAQGVPTGLERPEFGYSEEPHDWTWGEQGVCLYCSHCSLVNEILPIERLGFPMRVTEYPASPDDKCRWILYRDPREIPAEAYERVGKTKPTAEELERRWEAVRAPALVSDGWSVTGLLDGKSTIVTGAGKGIARACALEFARQGALLTICDIDESTGADAAREIEQLGAPSSSSTPTCPRAPTARP